MNWDEETARRARRNGEYVETGSIALAILCSIIVGYFGGKESCHRANILHDSEIHRTLPNDNYHNEIIPNREPSDLEREMLNFV